MEWEFVVAGSDVSHGDGLITPTVSMKVSEEGIEHDNNAVLAAVRGTFAGHHYIAGLELEGHAHVLVITEPTEEEPNYVGRVLDIDDVLTEISSYHNNTFHS